MLPRLPLDSLSISRTNIPLSPALSLSRQGGFEQPLSDYDAKSTSEVMIQLMGEVLDKTVVNSLEDDEPGNFSSVNSKPPGVSLRKCPLGDDMWPTPSYQPYQPSGPTLSLHRTETLFSSCSSEDDDGDSNTFSPVTSLGSDDGFDYERAMSFAKMRAANLGMGAAMLKMSAILEAEDPAAEDRLPQVAAKVIASISRSPTGLERHFSYSSVLSDSSDDDDLTETERQECDMVTEYVKRWASNDRLDSTYWQGFTPLHLTVAVPLVQELTVYLAEQAIRDVSAHLNMPPPLEYERSRPRLTASPTHAGSARVADSGHLVRRAMPPGYDPQQVLDQRTAAFNEELAANERKPVQAVALRLQSGAKRAAGTRKEATARRDPWTRTASKLRGELTAWMLTQSDEDAVAL